MTTIFDAWPYGRFIEIQRNFRRKKLHKINQVSNFPGGSFSNRECKTMSTPTSLKMIFPQEQNHPFSHQ